MSSTICVHTLYTLPTDTVQQEPSFRTCIYSEREGQEGGALSHSKTDQQQQEFHSRVGHLFHG